MPFAENLRTLRKRAGLSQEALSERLHLSRQAVTKWETEQGFPDIDNLRALAALFGVTMEELLDAEAPKTGQAAPRYESVTEYDLDRPKRCDIKLGGAKRVVVEGYAGEKLRLRLTSEVLSDLQKEVKVRLDDTGKRIDVDVLRPHGLSQTAVREGLEVLLQLPQPYLTDVEISAQAREVEVRSLCAESLELDLRSARLVLDGAAGRVEINDNLDLEILCRTLEGAVELNQINASSRLYLPEGAAFSAEVRGIGNRIGYERGGAPAEPFDTAGADNRISLNGLGSELILARA